MNYDFILIGAGMSGMAASIRLSMMGKSVLLLEKHSVPGGLNSYYQRGKDLFDVGLHALTNFQGKAMTKVLRQLRIRFHEWQLEPQTFSRIHFKSHQLNFSNDQGERLSLEIKEKWGDEAYGEFLKLREEIRSFPDEKLYEELGLAKEALKKRISNAQLRDMLLSPLLIYGSARENDMDWTQFVIMFKALYEEGFSRPKGGVRTLIQTLLKRLDECHVKIHYQHEVSSLEKESLRVHLKDGQVFQAREGIISTIGHEETLRLLGEGETFKNEERGRLSFIESLFVLKDVKSYLGPDKATITFYNDSDEYHYEKPEDLFDPRSAVVCFPDQYHGNEETRQLRVTYIGNYELWKNLKLKKEEYAKAKKEVLKKATELLHSLGFHDMNILKTDIFTPLSIERYTGHIEGTVYGAQKKIKNGFLAPGLYLAGTDQGFLGIVGALLSGVSVANQYARDLKV